MWCKKDKTDRKLKSMASCLKKIPFDSMYDALIDNNISDENRTLTFKAGPLDLSFWSFLTLTFLHRSIEKAERHFLWKVH